MNEQKLERARRPRYLLIYFSFGFLFFIFALVVGVSFLHHGQGTANRQCAGHILYRWCYILAIGRVSKTICGCPAHHVSYYYAFSCNTHTVGHITYIVKDFEFFFQGRLTRDYFFETWIWFASMMNSKIQFTCSIFVSSFSHFEIISNIFNYSFSDNQVAIVLWFFYSESFHLICEILLLYRICTFKKRSLKNVYHFL